MNTTILLKNDYIQLILTPENKFEKQWIKNVGEQKISFKQYIGMYHCQGGWEREGDDKDSLMFVFEKEE